MLPADKIQNVEHVQLQRNTEMLNKKKNNPGQVYSHSGRRGPFNYGR
jgi:hypothetical protein